MNKRRRRVNPIRIAVLSGLVLVVFYINQVVVPATPPLFVPTATPTRAPESYVHDAQALEMEGKFVQAIEAYRAAIDVEPKNAGNYISLARLQIYTGDYEGAITSAENALLINPNNAMAHALRGYALGNLGNYLTAEETLQDAIEQDPNNAIPYAYLAEVIAMKVNSGQGDLTAQEDARMWSRKAVDLNSDLLEVHRARGVVLEMFGGMENYEQAALEYRAAIEKNPNLAGLHVALGRIYRIIEAWGDSEDEFLKAITLNPTDATAYAGLSLTLLGAGDYARAIQYAESALQVEPTNPYWHGNLGRILYKQQNYPKALEYLRLAVKGGEYETEDQGSVVVEPYSIEEEPQLRYYMYYGLTLAFMGQCGEALEVSQYLSMTFPAEVPGNENITINTQEMVDICQRLLETGTTADPTAQPASNE